MTTDELLSKSQQLAQQSEARRQAMMIILLQDISESLQKIANPVVTVTKTWEEVKKDYLEFCSCESCKALRAYNI